MNKTGYYRATSYYWDDEDREYKLECVWYYEDGHREIPDTLKLESIAVDEQEDNAPDIEHLLTKDGDIWRMVERDGAIRDAEYIDDRDYFDYDFYVDEVY
jgi:hypothetical protein